MKILIVGKFYTEGFAQHIAETFLDMGHQVQLYEPGLAYNPTNNLVTLNIRKGISALHEIYTRTQFYNKRVKNKLLSQINNSIDFTVVCHDFLTPEQVEGIRLKTGSPIVLWFPDHIGAFGKSMFLNAPYDFLFFKDPYIVSTLKNDLNKSAYYLPECCNPRHHKKVQLSEADWEKYGCDISTAGNLHPNRIALFEQLSGYEIKIWGNPAPQWAITRNVNSYIKNEFVANEEKSKSFLASKIVINNLQPAEVIGVNVRTFEIAATGAFQLINWRSGLSQLYSSEEMVSFKTIPELRELIDYYLNDNEKRLLIAEKAWERTHNEHTYQKRLQLMLDTVFEGLQGFQMHHSYYS